MANGGPNDSITGLGAGGMTTVGNVVLTSTTAALVLTRMTSTQRDAMDTKEGMIIYNTTTEKINFRASGSWQAITSA